MKKTIIKRMILAVLASMLITAPAFSGEKIQLAAAIGSGSSGTSTSRSGAIGSISRKDDATGAEDLSAASDKGMSTANMVSIGVIGAGAIAAIAGGGSTSSTSHTP